MPGAFGGLMRYDEEYQSRFMLNPTTVIIFIVLIIFLVLILKAFFSGNLVDVASDTQTPFGLISSLLSWVFIKK